MLLSTDHLKSVYLTSWNPFFTQLIDPMAQLIIVAVTPFQRISKRQA